MKRSDSPRMDDRLRHLFVACVVSLAMTGCCPDNNEGFDSVLVNLDNSVTAINDHNVVVWVGDHSTVIGTAYQSPNEYCSGDGVRYTSKTSPGTFTFKSSDTTVATISATGTLTARAIGMTVITATTTGISQTMHVYVVAPIASVSITVTPPAPRALDTITFRLQAFDAAGATADSSAALRLTVVGAGNLFAYTPVTIHTVGSFGQTITATAEALHDGAPPSTPKVTATVTVTVGPPPS